MKNYIEIEKSEVWDYLKCGATVLCYNISGDYINDGRYNLGRLSIDEILCLLDEEDIVFYIQKVDKHEI